MPCEPVDCPIKVRRLAAGWEMEMQIQKPFGSRKGVNPNWSSTNFVFNAAFQFDRHQITSFTATVRPKRNANFAIHPSKRICAQLIKIINVSFSNGISINIMANIRMNDQQQQQNRMYGLSIDWESSSSSRRFIAQGAFWDGFLFKR